MDGSDPYLMQPRKKIFGHINGFLEAFKSVIGRAHIVESFTMYTDEKEVYIIYLYI